MGIGDFDLGDVFTGEIGWEPALPELVLTLDFSFGLRRRSIKETNVVEFERPAQLKSYFGWVPKIAQSGSSLDWSRLTPRGVRQMRQTMYLIVWRAIQWDTDWKEASP